MTALEEVLEILVPVSQSLNAQTKGVAQMVTVPKGLVLAVFSGTYTILFGIDILDRCALSLSNSNFRAFFQPQVTGTKSVKI